MSVMSRITPVFEVIFSYSKMADFSGACGAHRHVNDTFSQQPNESCGSRALMPEWVLWVSGSCLGRGNFKNCVMESIGDGRNSARIHGGIFSGNMMNKRENKLFFIQHRFTQWATHQ